MHKVYILLPLVFVADSFSDLKPRADPNNRKRHYGERERFRCIRKTLQMLKAIETKNRVTLSCTSLLDEDPVETEQLFEGVIIEEYRIRWHRNY